MSRSPDCLLILVASLFSFPVAATAQSIGVRPLEPEPIHIRVDDLPEPYHSQSANSHPHVVPPPQNPVLNVPRGFQLNVFAEVANARWLAQTPEGEVLCAASRDNRIVLLQDSDGDGTADQQHDFVTRANGANLPFGMAFVSDTFFLGNTSSVLRYPYDGSAAPGRRVGDPQRITTLPGQGYNQHWTRNVVVAPDGMSLFVSVGSETNADVEELPRASILQMGLDGSGRKVFASGLRNPVGLDFHPETGKLYATVNERDKLGDDLVPDYLAQVNAGEFYGWPYAWLAPNRLDPRHVQNDRSVRPDLAAETVTPKVLFQAHSAALGLAFYDGDRFPQRYRNGAFVAFRGSWNRDRGTGYKIVFVPFNEEGRPLGHYEDFVTGFLIKPEVPETWGRPVGVLVTSDGSLLFTEEANGRIYRVAFEGGNG